MWCGVDLNAVLEDGDEQAVLWTKAFGTEGVAANQHPPDGLSEGRRERRVVRSADLVIAHHTAHMNIVPIARSGALAVATALALFSLAPTALADGSANTRTPASPTYTIALTSDSSGRHWSGTEQVEFHNPSSVTLGTVWLRLWSNGVRGCSYAGIQVSQVSGGNAGSLSRKCTALPVTLDQPLGPGGSATISMHVAISVPSKNDRFGYHSGLAMLGTVLPTLAIHDGDGWHLDPFIDLGESFYSVVGEYHVSLTVPRALSTPSTGVLTDSHDNSDGTQTRTYSASHVRDFEWAAGHLSSVQDTDSSGTRVRVSYNPSTYSASAAHGALTKAVRAMNEFEHDFGAYPYPELDVVLSPLPYHGMEYPTFVLSDTRQISIGHEIAHQWWYGIVGNDQFSSPWLDESLAAWSEALPWTPYTCTTPHAWPSSATRLTNSMAFWGSHPKQYWVIYDQGTCALGAMAHELGMNRFIGVLRDYAAANRYGIATTADFKAAVEKAAKDVPGWDIAQFWRTWRIGAG